MRTHTFVLATLLSCSVVLTAQTTRVAQPHDRIADEVDDSHTVTLFGNVHPLIRQKSGTKANNVPMDKMILTLKGDAQQEGALAALLTGQQDPHSPLYHRFLTPAEFGAQFGASDGDLNKVKNWLKAYGFTVEDIPVGHRSIVFSGTSEQVESAFQTPIARLALNGQVHFANEREPQIPAAFADVVQGIVRLHNFQHQAASRIVRSIGDQSSPEFTSGSSHYLSPADYATIYDISPLYSASVNGTGTSIAVIARSDISLDDVQQFRLTMGLQPNAPSFVYAGNDPGVVSGDADETTLDTEWSGAVAPNAAVKIVVAASTNTADGIDLSAQYAVNNSVAKIISVSYGSCEAYMGSGEMAFYNSLWQQAAAQGITVLVSSGDWGAAGCGQSSTGAGIQGVNGLCSSPYSTCVGGTEFVEGSNPGQYWLPGNNAQYGSATGYIPETVWNDSGANGGSGLWAGGGGASIVFKKPTWQAAPGVPADGARDVPDVSLTASTHDGYLIAENGGFWVIAGTSASAPSFAGMMALVQQKTKSAWGNVNAILYPLAKGQAAGGAPIFHDTTMGNNSVPGLTGFSAGPGYDLASGLGSVDAAVMVNHWADGANTTPSLTITASVPTINVAIGSSSKLSLATSASNVSGAVALAVTGSTSNVSAVLTSSSIASPGSGTTTLTVQVSNAAAPGSYRITVSASAGSLKASTVVTVIVPTPGFKLAIGAASATAAQGAAVSVPVSVSAQNGWNSSVTLSITNLPSGVTASFQPATVASGNGSSTLTLTAANSAKAGTYALTITGKNGAVSQSSPLSLVITSPGTCTLTATQASVSLTAGTPASESVVCGSVQGSFAGPLKFSVSGQAIGVTASFATTQASAGSANVLSITADPTVAKAGQFTLMLVASLGSFKVSTSLPVTLTLPASTSPAGLTLTPATAGITIKPGSSASIALAASRGPSFTANVNIAFGTLPAGISGTLTNTTLPASGAFSVTFSVGASTASGTYAATVKLSSGAQSWSIPISLTVSSTPSYTFQVSATSMSIKAGGQGAPLTVSSGNYTAGFKSTIVLTITGLPPGMNYSFLGGTAQNNFVNITYSIYAAGTPPGTYPLTVSSSGGGNSYKAMVLVTVAAAAQAKAH